MSSAGERVEQAAAAVRDRGGLVTKVAVARELRITRRALYKTLRRRPELEALFVPALEAWRENSRQAREKRWRRVSPHARG